MTSVLPSEENLRRSGHVLVIGVDGVRFDLVGPGTAPSVWRLGRAGFLARGPGGGAAPPCPRAGIAANARAGHGRAGHPDFVTVATRAGLPTLLAVSGWPPLALAEDGGPLFADATRREFSAVPEADPA